MILRRDFGYPRQEFNTLARANGGLAAVRHARQRADRYMQEYDVHVDSTSDTDREDQPCKDPGLYAAI